MNLNTIAEAIAEMQRQLDLLRREVEDARTMRDPFASFLYRTRREFRRTALHDGKSGKRTRELLERSYWAAERLGFRGSIRDWAELLRYGSERIGEPVPNADPDHF